MYFLNTRILIQRIPERWKLQSGIEEQRNLTAASKKRQKLSQLNTNTATVEEVNQIMGNDSWTRITCDECSKTVESVVIVGNHADESQSICKECCIKMLEKFTA